MRAQCSYCSSVLKKKKKEEEKKKRKQETQNADAQEAQSKLARSHVNFFNGSCSLNLHPNLKPNFFNFLK